MKKRAKFGTLQRTIDAALASESDECFIWPHYIKAIGYGYPNISIGGKTSAVHRLVCERTHGPAPFPKAFAIHSCDTPACINPRHIRWGSHQENMDDKTLRGRNKPNGLVGEQVTNSKLTEKAVLEIREKYKSGITQKQLAEQHGVGPTLISYVLARKAWAHVQ